MADYYGIAYTDKKWYPVQVAPIALSPLRCKLVAEWNISFDEREQASQFLFNVLASKNDLAVDVHILSEGINFYNFV